MSQRQHTVVSNSEVGDEDRKPVLDYPRQKRNVLRTLGSQTAFGKAGTYAHRRSGKEDQEFKASHGDIHYLRTAWATRYSASANHRHVLRK